MYEATVEAMFAIRNNVDGKWYTSATEAHALSSLLSIFDLLLPWLLSECALDIQDLLQ